jgi:hypothetical protein
MYYSVASTYRCYIKLGEWNMNDSHPICCNRNVSILLNLNRHWLPLEFDKCPWPLLLPPHINPHLPLTCTSIQPSHFQLVNRARSQWAPSSIEVSIPKYHSDPDNQCPPRGERGHQNASMRVIGPKSGTDSAIDKTISTCRDGSAWAAEGRIWIQYPQQLRVSSRKTRMNGDTCLDWS